MHESSESTSHNNYTEIVAEGFISLLIIIGPQTLFNLRT